MLDNNYVQSMEAWFKSVELAIKQTEHDISNSKVQIELHQQSLVIDEKQLLHDRARLEVARQRYAEYLELNK